MEHRECWVGLSVLVGVFVIEVGRINRFPICIYGGFMDMRCEVTLMGRCCLVKLTGRVFTYVQDVRCDGA